MRGVSTRKVDDLVRAIGASGVSLNEVRRLVGDLGGALAAFRGRRLAWQRSSVHTGQGPPRPWSRRSCARCSPGPTNRPRGRSSGRSPSAWPPPRGRRRPAQARQGAPRGAARRVAHDGQALPAPWLDAPAPGRHPGHHAVAPAEGGHGRLHDTAGDEDPDARGGSSRASGRTGGGSNPCPAGEAAWRCCPGAAAPQWMAALQLSKRCSTRRTASPMPIPNVPRSRMPTITRDVLSIVPLKLM